MREFCPSGPFGLARHGMFAAGLVPHELWAVAERAEREGSPLGATPKVSKERIDWLADEYEVDIHVDVPEVDVLVTFSPIEIMKYPASLVATAKVLNHAGYSWTVSSKGYEATNFGMLSGNVEWQRHMSMKLIDAAIDCKSKILVLPECGLAYTALRWQGANMLERRETEDTGDLNLCCGGGGGVVTIHRADELRYKTFAVKMSQIEQAQGGILASSCSNCRQTFDDGAAHFAWNRKMESLLELVADNLAERA